MILFSSFMNNTSVQKLISCASHIVNANEVKEFMLCLRSLGMHQHDCINICYFKSPNILVRYHGLHHYQLSVNPVHCSEVIIYIFWYVCTGFQSKPVANSMLYGQV